MSTDFTYFDVLERLSGVEVDVWQSQFDVVDKNGIFRLLHYHPTTQRKYKTPLLIAYAFINRPYVLDLSPDISVIKKYLDAGLDVYMIDWGYPTRVDQYITIDDYVNYIDKCVDYIRWRENVNRVSLHGYCLGGDLSVIYTVLHQEKIRNLMLQATPIDFDTDNTLAIWAKKLDVDRIVDTFRLAPGDFLNVGFLLVDPINLLVGKYHGMLEMLEEKRFLENFLRMEKWIFDAPAIPGETYRQYIKEWYQQNLIVKNEFVCDGIKIDLSKINIPLLVIAATYDHIAPLESQKAILNLISSRDKDVYEYSKGHIGITTSRASHKEYWPQVIKWLEERSIKV